MRLPANHSATQRLTGIAAVVTLCAMFFGTSVLGQTISPTAPPPGGQTAPPLNASSQAQKKSGSLIIGAQNPGTCDFGLGGNQNGCARLCLNAGLAVDPATSVDTAVCIRSWKDLGSAVSGAFLPLSSAPFAAIPTKSGYARLQGNAIVPSTGLPVGQPYTLHVTSGADIGATALYVDGRLSDNNAGYFWGRTAISNALSGSPGRICLNSTNSKSTATPTELANGTYCISNWTEIAPVSPADKLTLQTASTTVAESGSVNLDRSFAAGSFVIGDPSVLPASLSGLTCGDGLCSANESSASCAIDCAAVNPVAIFLGSPGVDLANLNIMTGAQAGSATVRILIVRSTNSTLGFQPVNGIVYAPGIYSGYTIVNSSVQPANTVLPVIVDNTYGISGGQTYYYWVYQSNMYPRYATTAKTQAVTPTSGGGDGGGIDPPIIPPIRPR